MSTIHPEEASPKPEGAPNRGHMIALAILGLALLGTLAGLFHQSSQLGNTRTEVANLKRDVTAVRQELVNFETRLREKFEVLTAQLASTQDQALKSVDRARLATRRQTEAIITKVSANHEAKRKELADELERLKSSTLEATAKLTDIGTEVGTVKTEVGDVKTQVSAQRTDLDRTIAEMRRVNGDLGVMSGLIATNSKEISALRALGERDYYEFSLSKAQRQRSLAGINLVFKKADPKRNRFTVDIVADDRRVEKKDRTTNEPVQFYVPSKARIPFELVINDIKKDLIVGYLSVPKTQVVASR